MGTCSRELLPKSCRGFVGVPRSLGTMGGCLVGHPPWGWQRGVKHGAG